MITKTDIEDMEHFKQPKATVSDINKQQVGGTHYMKLNPAPWDVIIAWKLGYLEGTALKYIARWQDKGGLDDLRKAIHFLQKKIEIESGPAK